MTPPARLLSLRLQGFKSFAERTVVEFGPGISAIVGPNGSGKSNLADALRWTLGEQGRALRSRKAEDVIFAGSERRAALGMADVTLVLDNADGLLPVEFSVLEIGRRLYRSGENEYLLNRQRVRLRDLVELLDGAHLADNAFLFIGQGMVDQALALRPEERRPLFEEVAGVRRHERRRRRAEEQLAESESNLARVEDILAELRPQLRRLAVQAEQHASRAVAGEELATALVAVTHQRWFDASSRVAAAAQARRRVAGETDRALAELEAAERSAGAIAAELESRTTAERERRAAHDAAREALTELRLREVRLAGDLEALRRDRERVVAEREAAVSGLAAHRRVLAEPSVGRDLELEAAVAEAERALAEGLAELAELRAARRARGEEAAALRRAEAARQAETETARRRLAEAERRAADERARATAAAARRRELEADRDEVARALARALDAESVARAAHEEARAVASATEAARIASVEAAARTGAAVAALEARVATLEAALDEEEARGIARAARRRGGRRVDEELVVEPALRAAVEAALAETVRAYVVPGSAVAELAGERGVVVPVEALATPADRDVDAAARRARERILDRVRDLGGGPLADAVRRDPTGAATRLLGRAAWLPDLEACLAIRAELPPGWLAVARDGSVVVTEATVAYGRPDSLLERRAEAARLRAELERAREDRGRTDAAAAEAEAAAGAARAALDRARSEESRAAAERRRAEEVDRRSAGELEAVVREATWHEAQAQRLESEVARLRDALATALQAAEDGGTPDAPGDAADPEGRALEAWEARVAELRARRDRLSSDLAAREAQRREAEARIARAAAGAALDEERIARTARDLDALAAREQELRAELDALATRLAEATEAEARARSALDEVLAAEAADRGRLATAEAEAAAARERLRAAEDRLRAADREDLEARLGLESLREQLLVELAGLGDLGLRVLDAQPGTGEPGEADPAEAARAAETAPADAESASADAGDAAAAAAQADRGDATAADASKLLEGALDRAATRWASAPPPGDVPSSARLAYLRRRYHELGAGNPFAVEEYEALRARVDGLEHQQRDLRQAIDRTRELIAELNAMIADQFRSTFRALEVAFDARFQQLFGGGFARLSLTDPADLSSTGVEIVARPPGKKPQALAMLSGGERALTAVALLFAMLEVRPVPFCVLDEVDAALDEANVGRFTDALRGLATQTQFVVITHNRGTIEAADALYGVTVGDDSVSRVISLRLDEARELAERRERELVEAPTG